VAQTGVSLKHRIQRFPLFLPKAFQLINAVNPLEGVRAYEENKQEEVCAASCGYREAEQHPDNTSGCVGGTINQIGTAEKATRPRGRIHALAASFFNNWRRESSAPIDPVRTFYSNHNLPRTTAPHRPVSVRLPLAQIPALSPSLDEIHAKLICNLAGVKFGAIWPISEKSLVLFQDPITTTSLVLPVNNFCVQAVRSHVRESREKFGIGEDL
jgi:hypothetical protein